ncbi:MAG TPA: hypothetical protein VF223_04120 [Trebonia sp.]
MHVGSIANIAAPTVAELNAGTRVSAVMTADGLVGFEAETADVDNSSIESTFDTKTIGRASYTGTMLRCKKQTGTDTVFDLLVRGTDGYIVIRRDVPSDTAFAAGQKVEVYPGIAGETRFLPPEPNSTRKYEVPWKINSEPELRAEVAA